MPDTPNRVQVSLGVVVRVAVVQIHVPSICRIVLCRRPEVVGRIRFLLSTFATPPFIPRYLSRKTFVYPRSFLE